MDPKKITNGVTELANQLIREAGLSLNAIAEAGGLTRQTMYRSHSGENAPSKGRVTGYGLSVIAAAVKHGYIPEVLSVLTGEKVQPTTILRAVGAYPDITIQELELLRRIEDRVNLRPLPLDLIKDFLHSYRTPKS